MDEKLDITQQHTLAAQKGQTYPGLHPNQCGQQGKGEDCLPLLCSGEASPGVLRSDLRPQDKKGVDLLG